MINHLYPTYLAYLQEQKLTANEILTMLGIPPTKLCCRRTFLSFVDIHHDLNQYAEYQDQVYPNHQDHSNEPDSPKVPLVPFQPAFQLKRNVTVKRESSVYPDQAPHNQSLSVPVAVPVPTSSSTSDSSFLQRDPTHLILIWSSDIHETVGVSK